MRHEGVTYVTQALPNTRLAALPLTAMVATRRAAVYHEAASASPHTCAARRRAGEAPRSVGACNRIARKSATVIQTVAGRLA